MAGVPVYTETGVPAEVKLTQTAADVGYAAVVSENDAGDITGAPLLSSPETTFDYRLRVGVDTPLFDRTFNHPAQDTGTEIYRNATMTIGWAALAGVIVTNSGSVIAASNAVSYASQRFFPMFGATPTYVEFAAAFTNVPTTNTFIDIGIGLLGIGGAPYAPTDGVFFRLDPAGLKAVTAFNSVEVETLLTFTITPLTVYRFVLAVSDRLVRFWIDDVLYATIERPITQGTLTLLSSGQFAMRHAIVGSNASGVQQVRLSSWKVDLGDVNAGIPWGSLAAGGGRMGYQGLAGGTMGSTASYANITNPAGAAGSNTATLVSGLGGQGQLNAAAGAVTDLIMTSYQVPTGGLSTQTPRNLVITGVWVSACNFGATVATTPTTLLWCLAFGHTTVTMVPTENATSKGRRIIPLGIMSVPVGALAGTTYTPDRIYVSLRGAPVIVNPSEFVATTAKILTGTATGSQTVYFTVGFESYWE